MEQIYNMILCTGNPTHNTVASAVNKRISNVDFASRATGYDLRFWEPDSEDFFKNKIKNYTVFINSSYICRYGQLTLLETVHQVWSDNNIRGHVINIGSSSEYLGTQNIDNSTASNFGSYSIQKRALRDRSLQLNSLNNIKTTHITAGGLNDGKPGHENWLNLAHMANLIEWIINHPCTIPIIGISV
jgi:hypothetical protein